MRLEPNPARTIPRCKVKAVKPPFRSVSPPRGRKDLRVVGRVNPFARSRTRRLRLDLSEWNARRLARKLEEELSRGAWQRLSTLATDRGSTVAQFLETGLLEAP